MVGFAMCRLRWRITRISPGPATASGRHGVAALGAVLAVAAGGLGVHPQYLPGPGALAGNTAGSPAASRAEAVAAFHRIVLPDLAVIDPRGLSPARLARLGKLRGVRQVLAVDGAGITVGGHRLNAIGVSPAAFRSWTPLGTASRQRLWDSLAADGFLASPAARRELGLRVGHSYPLAGAGTARLRFGGAAPLGVAGISLVVSNRASARLGLIHNVAALISAPGAGMPALERAARAAAGHAATVVSLRPRRVPAAPVPTGRPTTYLQLFQASAARYCPGLPWTVLAAIGEIESGDGANDGPSSAGALGPMQFLPSTWQVWGITAFGEKGPPNIMDPYDAVPAAARYLCAAGGATPAGLPGAIFAYNHARWYVAEVLALARQYARAYG
jgi:hypothetical protein